MGSGTPRRQSLLNHAGKDLREIQELLRHKNIRTTVRYTHVGYKQTRQTAEALSHSSHCGPRVFVWFDQTKEMNLA